MEFDKDHLVIIESLTLTEAIAFVKFLKTEVLRHQDDIRRCVELVELVNKKFV